ncbi:hypothetical protein [Streptomyces sp. A1136]|uniref:hypothetical protein n=1 Tax=Streptomyces sp. A1136 TaxID=2563102 RepID=UPI00109EDCF3|nr:hypothetical protein [Streptomyces sp. A1136]THA47505.1 hypothetical protein E6R62_31330 [Streptomyces sp. A1136]
MEHSKDIARITAIESPAARADASALADLAPAAAAALRLLSDAIKRGADYESIVEALKAAQLPEAFASVLDAASEAVMAELDQPDVDPYDFDIRLEGDNLSGAASDIRNAFRWL